MTSTPNDLGDPVPPGTNPVSEAEVVSFTNRLMFETTGGVRFTQDGPILPTVWIAFATKPMKQQELILTVVNSGGTGKAASALRRMLRQLRTKRPMVGDERRKPARVSYIPGQIAVKIYFDELMRVVLPLTPWWHQTYDKLRRLQHTRPKQADVADWMPFPQPDPNGGREKDLVDALVLMRREIDHVAVDSASSSQSEERTSYVREIPSDLSWLVRIAGIIADCFDAKKQMLVEPASLASRLNEEFKARDRIAGSSETVSAREEQARNEPKFASKQMRELRDDIVKAFTKLYTDWAQDDALPRDRLIWRVTKNRPIHLAVDKSALTVKADAARRLFDISCKDITWAVLDTGIDSGHDAFKTLSPEYERELRREAQKSPGPPVEELALSEVRQSRIVMTLDFTNLRKLLDYNIGDDDADETEKKRLEELKFEIARRLQYREEGRRGGNAKRTSNAGVKDDRVQRATRLLKELRDRIHEGRDISWEDLEDAIVDHNPNVPLNDHGTHVAGILAADWVEDVKAERTFPLSRRTRRMQGVCPDIRLIDVRVYSDDGLTDEFELIAAIQYLRWMNSRAGTMRVHGANISLSLVHEVRRFACGRTPICEECNEAAKVGMVIVAAAGNRGFEMADIDHVSANDSYRSVSITDPGNADGVITVGSTHRKRPHEYGVSYFSSRGPTGDGRLKPDLVAPGEKIVGPIPNGRSEAKDGTSMAAPHVSGAAALLMARHSELIEQPASVKSILCKTAVPLGREPYFQGAGLLDALLALQEAARALQKD